MWNPKNQPNKQNRNRLTDTENKLVVARGEDGSRLGEIGEGDLEVQIASYEINHGCNEQQREYSQ